MDGNENPADDGGLDGIGRFRSDGTRLTRGDRRASTCLGAPPPLSEHRSRPLRRVLHVMGLNPGIKFGSLEEQVLQVARAFRERGGHFVPVFDAPLAGRTLAAYDAAGITVGALSLRRFEMSTLHQLIQMIGLHQVELVNWSFYDPMSPYVWALSVIRPHVRHILTDHISRYTQQQGNPSRMRRFVKTMLFPRYERIVCVSDFVKDVYARQGIDGRTLSLRHFINTHRFRPDTQARQSLRREFHADSRFVLLAVAHLIREKGIDVLLRALVQLPESVVAWIAGDGPARRDLENLAQHLGLARRVTFLGNQPEVQPYMQAADCLVCPSVWEEASGLVNIEALACGLPVVASRTGGIPEIVNHEVSGLLFAPGDAEGLGAAARQLYERPDLRESMSRAARRVAIERYSVESLMEEYLDLYRVPPPAGRTS